MAKTREELERAQRKREAEAQKREKAAAKAERDRLRALIEQDKRERAANKGKLSSKLGAGGYNPSMPPASVPYGAAGAGADGAGEVKEGEETKGAGEAPALSPEEAIDKAIATVSKYRTGGDGGVALKTLKAYTSNALKDDPKFRSINMDNNAFRTRVAPFIGGVALLRALGFEKDPAENRLVLPEGGDHRARLQETVAKLEAAMASYQGH
ncbi:unnamed protein product [Heterosigma akashiwo]